MVCVVRGRPLGCFSRIQTVSRDTYPYLMICQLKVLTLSFHLHQGGPLKAFGSPRNAYMAAYWHTQSAACCGEGGGAGCFAAMQSGDYLVVVVVLLVLWVEPAVGVGVGPINGLISWHLRTNCMY